MHVIGYSQRVPFGVALSLCLGLSSPASADNLGIDALTLRPVSDSGPLFSVWEATVHPAGESSLALFGDLGFRALRLSNSNPSLPQTDIVQWRTNLHAMASVGVFGFLQIGVEVPWVLFAAAESDVDNSFTRSVLGYREVTGNRLGDISAVVKSSLSGQRGWLPATGAVVRVTLPTGDPLGLAGEPGAVVEANVIASRNFSRHLWAINAGYRLRTQPVRLGVENQVDGQIVWRAGLRYGSRPRRADDGRLGLILEAGGTVPIGNHTGPLSGAEMEARAGIQQRFRTGARSAWGLSIGLGVGALRSAGTPLARLFVNVDFLSDDPSVDDDSDGVPNRQDRCPDDYEDLDGFEDDDGCLDGDNDGDGLDDEEDECPNRAEDLDGIEDLDGCPDADEPDDDGDRYFGADDKCPAEAEDFDGFEDWDGCPEPDNDQDQLPDLNDLCPDAPEDINGFEDDDGCPDAGRGRRLFALGPNGELKLYRQVRFVRGQSAVSRRSEPVLVQLARELRSGRQLARLRISVHPEGKGARHRELVKKRVDELKAEFIRRQVEPEQVDIRGAPWNPRRRGDVEVRVLGGAPPLPEVQKRRPKKQKQKQRPKQKRRRRR